MIVRGGREREKRWANSNKKRNRSEVRKDIEWFGKDRRGERKKESRGRKEGERGDGEEER